MLGGVAMVLLAALVLWAWRDGGQRPLVPMEAPAMLPKVGQ